jgi:putative NADPH-quinone reductase
VKASVLLAHPYEKSLNHAIFRTVCEKLDELKVETFSHDLYAEKSNPVMTQKELGTDRSEDALVNQYAEELVASEFLILVHPNWWGQLGKLKGKTGIVFNTSNTEESRENAVFGDPLEDIWKNCIFGFRGMDSHYRKMFRIVADSHRDQRTMWLKETADIIEHAVNNQMR